MVWVVAAQDSDAAIISDKYAVITSKTVLPGSLCCARGDECQCDLYEDAIAAVEAASPVITTNDDEFAAAALEIFDGWLADGTISKEVSACSRE